MFGFFKCLSENKRKEAHELELKKSLSERLSSYDKIDISNVDILLDKTDFTEISIYGKKMKFIKEHITIFDVSNNELSCA